ncbi:MAG TPA: energy transducer TonB [Polyangiaceae bacterium]|nr:energy transducer TonB [Polyangiaceae bacterium]
MTVLAMTQSVTVEEATEEETLDVALATEPEPEPEPEPEAAPEPEPEPAPAAPRPAGPVMPQITTPTEIPDDAPKEAAADDSNPYASGDPFMYAGAAGTGPRTAAAPTVVKAEAPKPVAVQKPSGPERMTADTTPPQLLSQPADANVYPAAAKAAGIEGTVIVKLEVDEQGNTQNVRAVKGPDELRAACENRFKGSKFSPAIRDGHPVAVQQVKKCTYNLKT